MLHHLVVYNTNIPFALRCTTLQLGWAFRNSCRDCTVFLATPGQTTVWACFAGGRVQRGDTIICCRWWLLSSLFGQWLSQQRQRVWSRLACGALICSDLVCPGLCSLQQTHLTLFFSLVNVLLSLCRVGLQGAGILSAFGAFGASSVPVLRIMLIQTFSSSHPIRPSELANFSASPPTKIQNAPSLIDTATPHVIFSPATPTTHNYISHYSQEPNGGTY